jgi:ABC-2 type transport system permease protein
MLLMFWVMDIAAGDDKDSLGRYFSLLQHYENFNRGVIDTFDLTFFSLFILLFLVLSIHRLNGERLYG